MATSFVWTNAQVFITNVREIIAKKRSEGEKPEKQLLILTFSRRKTAGLIVAINVSKHLGFSGGPH